MSRQGQLQTDTLTLRKRRAPSERRPAAGAAPLGAAARRGGGDRRARPLATRIDGLANELRLRLAELGEEDETRRRP